MYVFSNTVCAVRLFAFSAAKAYAVLKEAGWQSGRKKREDAGVSSIDEKTLKLAASLLQNSVRKNGKKTMSVEIARAILRQNGFTVPISNSRLKQLLKEATLSTESTAKPAPHQRMRTEYPNQVHFADPSVALMYFAPGGTQNNTVTPSAAIFCPLYVCRAQTCGNFPFSKPNTVNDLSTQKRADYKIAYRIDYAMHLNTATSFRKKTRADCKTNMRFQDLFVQSAMGLAGLRTFQDR